MSALPMLSPSMDFDEAAHLVLDYLRKNIDLAFWSVTRVENGRQTYLYLDDDNGYGLPQGGSHAWEDSFCIHMAAGATPTVAPDAQQVPLYAAAGVNALVDIGTYAGAPVREPDGALFGAICGLDPQVRADDPALVAAAPVLQLFGQLLSMVLAANRARDEAAHTLATIQSEADTDLLTGLLNRRGWERAIEAESARFARLADPTVVLMIDLDQLKAINDEHGHQAGDAHLRTAGTAIRAAVRTRDVVARLGGDEFGVLMPGCTSAAAPDRVALLYATLAAHSVAGSVGWAALDARQGFPAALAAADAAMYCTKRERSAGRTRDVPTPRSEACDGKPADLTRPA